MDDNCLFCKIIKAEVDSTKVYEDDFICACNDIQKVAPVHVLIVPKIHIESTNEITKEDVEYISKIYEKIPEIAKKLGIYDTGYRIICNCGTDAGQLIKHLHFHLVGGKKLGDKII